MRLRISAYVSQVICATIRELASRKLQEREGLLLYANWDSVIHCDIEIMNPGPLGPLGRRLGELIGRTPESPEWVRLLDGRQGVLALERRRLLRSRWKRTVTASTKALFEFTLYAHCSYKATHGLYECVYIPNTWLFSDLGAWCEK